MRSGAKAVLMIARHLGANVSAGDIENVYPIDEKDLSLQQMQDFLSNNGVESDCLNLDFDSLCEVIKTSRMVLALNNERYVIAVRSFRDDDTTFVVLVDPTDASFEPKPLAKDDLLEIWSGRALAAKKRPSIEKTKEELSLNELITVLLKDYGLLVPVFILSIFGHIISLTPIVLLIITLDKVISYEGVSTLYVLVAGVLISFACGGLFRTMRDKSILLISHKVEARLSREIIRSILDLPFIFSQSNKRLISQSSAKIERISSFIKGLFSTTLYDFIGFIVFIPLLVSFSVNLFLVLCVFALIGIFLSRYAQVSDKSVRNTAGKARATRNAQFRDLCDGLVNVKSLGVETRVRERYYESEAQHLLMNETRASNVSNWRELSSFVQNLLSVTVLAYGALLVLQEAIPVGAMLAFYLLSQKIYLPLTNLAKFYSDYTDANSDLQDLNIVRNAEKVETRSGTKPEIYGAIELSGISCGYPNSEMVLKDINAQISSSTLVGITGPSGVGKTSLVRLLQKLVIPKGGIIYFDKNDSRTIDASYLRSNISVVSSSEYFSTATVKENLLLPLPNDDLSRLEWAIEKAGAKELIHGLENGLETILHGNASNISSGQRQLLALVRGLISNPRILILDDAMGLLGPSGELQVLETLKNLSEGRTVILISSQMWHLQSCDQVIVVEKGEVSHAGTWDSALQNSAYIKSAVDQQKRISVKAS
jgi:subfamily B ATP-binding cassette protein HlyB/CyaB